MDRNYKVYVHIAPNGKRYYGITRTEVKKRWGNGKGYKDNQYFTRAINKYGWDNFTHIILFDNLTKAEAGLLEQMYIALYDTTNPKYGYNISLGGEGGKGLYGELNGMYGKHHSEETRKKISEKAKGRTHTEEAKKKMSEAQRGKGGTKVYCVELDKYFDTINEASKYIGCNQSSISEVLIGRGKTCKGYHWIYAEDVNQENINRIMSQENNTKGKNNVNAKQIYCVELDKYFDTITEGAKYIECDYSNISSVLIGKTKTAKGYHFIYANEVNEENINKVMSEEYNINNTKGKNNYRATKVYCVELDMYFDTITEASKFAGCNYSNISAVLIGKTKTAGGYHWLYANEVNQENINRVMSLKAGKTKIYCVELDKYFDTINEASEYIGCHHSGISSVLRGKSKTAKGYHWLYAEEVNEENINKVMSEEYNINLNIRKVYCVELNMYFDTVKEAGEFVGCSDSNISTVLHGRRKTAGGYHWIYAEDVETIEIENNKVS